MKTRGFLVVALMRRECGGNGENAKVICGTASIANRSYLAAASLVADTSTMTSKRVSRRQWRP